MAHQVSASGKTSRTCPQAVQARRQARFGPGQRAKEWRFRSHAEMNRWKADVCCATWLPRPDGMDELLKQLQAAGVFATWVVDGQAMRLLGMPPGPGWIGISSCHQGTRKFSEELNEVLQEDLV